MKIKLFEPELFSADRWYSIDCEIEHNDKTYFAGLTRYISTNEEHDSVLSDDITIVEIKDEDGNIRTLKDINVNEEEFIKIIYKELNG